MVENEAEVIPINGIKLSFPSYKNFAIRFFELFDKSRIASNKYHIVLEILGKLLINTESFYMIKKKDGFKYCENFICSINSDIKIYEELISQFSKIKELEKVENQNNKKKLHSINQLVNNYDSRIEKQSSVIQEKPISSDYGFYINQILLKLNRFADLITENDLKKSIKVLTEKRDENDILVLSSITQMLLNQEKVKPKEIYSLISNFQDFKKNINNFAGGMIPKYNIDNINKSILIFYRSIDHLQNSDLRLVEKYKHLYGITNWILTAIELLNYKFQMKTFDELFHLKWKELEMCGKIMHLLNNEAQDIKNMLDNRENMDTIQKLIEAINEMKNFEESTIENSSSQMINNEIYDIKEEKNLIHSLEEDRRDALTLYENLSKVTSQNPYIHTPKNIPLPNFCKCVPSDLNTFQCFK